jgi:hypothetical protein
MRRSLLLVLVTVIAAVLVLWPDDPFDSNQEVKTAVVQLKKFNDRLTFISRNLELAGIEETLNDLLLACQEIQAWEQETPILEFPDDFGSIWFGPGASCGLLQTGVMDNSFENWGEGNRILERTKSCLAAAERRNYDYLEIAC